MGKSLFRVECQGGVGFLSKGQWTWHKPSSKKQILYLILTSSKRRQVYLCECVCVCLCRQNRPFNHRKAKCSTSLHGIHHHSPVLPDPSSIFSPSFLIRPLPLLALHPRPQRTPPPPLSHTHTISCQWSMPLKQSSFSSGFIIPRAPAKRWLKELFIKPGAVGGSPRDGHYTQH